MTREKALEIIVFKLGRGKEAERLGFHNDGVYSWRGKISEEREALDMAISALSENKGEWIPVSERLPEKNVWVLVTVEQNEMRYQEIMRRNNYKEGWTDNIDFYTDEITAWQPLPEPYKEGGNE